MYLEQFPLPSVRHISTVGSKIQHLVRHGRLPSIVLRFVIVGYLVGREILIFKYQILGWAVLVRVDGLTYSFLGDVSSNLYNGTVNFTSIAITPTQTVVTAQAGPMQVNLTFLNPIEVRFHSSVNFNVYIRIILSPKIGSGNPSRSHTWLSP